MQPDKETVVVEKINFIKRHSRPTQKAPKGGIIEKEGRLHVSKVTIVCSKCNRPVRIRNNRLEDGKKSAHVPAAVKFWINRRRR